MPNIIDYLDWRGDLSLEAFPLNEVDSVLLSRLSYIPFDEVVPQSFLKSTDLKSASEALLNNSDVIKNICRVSDLLLLKKMSQSMRFSNISLCGYINQWDKATEKQFSSVAIKILPNTYFISYRGTDNTLVGWKEDFNMSFICPVPSQKAAVSYIEAARRCLKGDMIIGGHSKGGNLAVYASAFCSADVQEHIKAVYNFDGPGFDSEILEREDYKKICNRVMTFIPQSSVVGMLLEHEEKYTVIKSIEKNGLMQHNIYSWEVLRDHFEHLDSVTDSSKFIDHTLKDWIKKMTPKQRELFVDTVYALIVQTGAHTLKELSNNKMESAKTILSSFKDLEAEDREIILKSMGLLLKSVRSSLLQGFD